MGTDSSMYSKLTRRRCYYDRVNNLERYWDLQNQVLWDQGDTIMELLKKWSNTFSGGATKEQVLTLLELNRQGSMETEHGRQRVGWTDKIERFVRSCPDDDRFQIIYDTDERWPACLDRYVEFEPD